MPIYTIYTAVGHLQLKKGRGGTRCPVIQVSQKEHMVNLPEMLLWSRLCWRLRNLCQLRSDYISAAEEIAAPVSEQVHPYFDDALARLSARGLIVAGYGDTEADALYDLLSNLYIVPISSSLVRFFNKKENARKAMEAAYQVEEAYQRAKAAMHDPNNPMRDDYSVDRSRSSITIHAGMDTFHWEIMAAKSEDTDDAKRAADKRRDRTGSRTEGHTEKPDKETEYEGLHFDSRAGH